MTDVVVSSEDVIVTVQQPTLPPSAPPPKIGLVEINQVVQRGSAWMTGSGPPTLAGGQYGDMYLDVDTGDIYLWDGTTWTFQGTFAPSTLTPAEILAALITVDGPGSLLDADTLDGHDSPYFATQAGLDANSARDDTQDTTLTSHSNSINANVIAINDLTTANTAQDTAINGKVAKAGDTMTGPLTVVTPPTQPAYAASKAYVDAQTSAITVVPPATIPPLMDGTAAVGTATKYAREDHKHPSDTAKIGDAPNDGVQYVRQSLAWSPVNVPPGTVVADTAPVSPQAGQMWLKSSTMVLYCWYVDPNTSQWVQVSASPQMVDNNYSRKTARRTNLIINGALNVSQENGNTEGTVTGWYAADQFAGNITAAGAAFGVSRIAANNPSGSQFRLQYRVTTAKASLAAGDNATIQTRLEGLDTQDLGWQGPTQKDAVLQFGFNGPAGTYCAAVRNGAQTHSFVASFTIAAGQALTDTLQVIKVPAPVGMTTWPTDNSKSMDVFISLAVGSTFVAAAGWNSGSFFGVTGMSNGLAAVQSFQIWDIGLYADPDKTSLAPTFEVSDYGTELAKCQRYYEREQLAITTALPGTTFNQMGWKAVKRAAPTLSATFDGGSGATFNPLGGGSGVNGFYQNTAHSAAATATVTGNARM